MPADAQGDKDEQDTELQILLSDYAALRDDERNTLAAQGVAVSIAIALIGGLVAFASQSCTLSSDHKGCTNVPVVFLAGAPAIPFAALGFIILQGVVSVVRSYYMRLVELEIQLRAPMKFSNFSKLSPISFVGLTTEILSLRRGRWSYRAVTGIIVLIATFTFGGITVYIAVHMDATTRNLMLLLYSISFLLVTLEGYTTVIRGRQLFLETVDNYNRHKNNLLTLTHDANAGERSILSYLLFPRTETIPKSALALIMFSIAASTTGAWQWSRFLLLWLILEYFAYAARYQWNDLRDFDADQSHPARDLRGRLPSGSRPRDTAVNMALSVTILLLRLGLAAFIGIETGILPQVALIVGTVFGVAVGYEAMRSRVTLVQSPSATASGTRLAAVVWLAVGPGYAIRGAVGLLAAHVRWTSPALYIGLTGLIALGIMLALIAWLFDATSFFRVTEDGTWHVKAAQPSNKNYARVLLRSLAIPIHVGDPDTDTGPRSQDDEIDGKQFTPLKHGRTGWSPWNISFACASILLCEFALSLSGGAALSAVTYSIIGCVSGVGAIFMICSNEQWKRWLTTVGFAGFMLLVARTTSSPHWLLTGVVWLAVATSYTTLCGMSFLDLVQALPRLRLRLVTAAAAVVKTTLGPTAFQYLRPHPQPTVTTTTEPRKRHFQSRTFTVGTKTRKSTAGKNQSGPP